MPQIPGSDSPDSRIKCNSPESSLVRAWAMRGTLRPRPARWATAYLALLGTARTWGKAVLAAGFRGEPAAAGGPRRGRRRGSGRSIVDPAGADRRGAGAPRSGGPGEQSASGWGTALKPPAWAGRLYQGAVPGAARHHHLAAFVDTGVARPAGPGGGRGNGDSGISRGARPGGARGVRRLAAARDDP